MRRLFYQGKPLVCVTLGYTLILSQPTTHNPEFKMSLSLILFFAATGAAPFGLALAVRSFDSFFADMPDGVRASLRLGC